MSAAKVGAQTVPSVASFIKIAIFWFALLHLGTIVVNSAGLSSRFLPHFAAGAFAIHSLLAISYVMSEGSTSRFVAIILICVVSGFAIFASRVMTKGMDAGDAREFISEAAIDIVGNLTVADRAFRRMGPMEHLAAAARLIFEDQSSSSMTQAQRHLRAITPNSPQYTGARRLLEVARKQTADAAATETPVVQILRREEKNGTLIVTLRNNGKSPVKNIAYDILYFRVGSGEPVGDTLRSQISNVLNPKETWILEVPASVAGPAHAAFSLTGWEVASGS